MSVRDLIPWGRNNGNQVPSVFRDGDRDPFLSLHREVNRLFDDAFRGFGFSSSRPALGGTSAFSGGWPSVEIADGEKELKVTAEVPGLEEKDIEVRRLPGANLRDGFPRAAQSQGLGGYQGPVDRSHRDRGCGRPDRAE